MSNKIESIAVLTSGGDAPGMNACIRSVVRAAIAQGLKVSGIERGYAGLLNEEIREMDAHSVSDIIQRGGTILYTARCMEFLELEWQKRGADILRERGIGALVVIGGDGSYKGALALARQGISVIGI
ncbi:MAG: 6-phosphofructokinase, partial [Lachnospiraceae bacterium]|nr:6-phosphofructokinase [Lachnospiraceae bacterium]